MRGAAGFPPVDAAVLAGGGPEPGLPSGVVNKAFLNVAGRPLVERVVEAVRTTPEVRRLVLVAPPQVPQTVAGLCDAVVSDQGDLLANVQAALDVLQSSGWVLVCAADLPLLSPRAVSNFLQACAAREADFYYGIVRREDLEGRFPGARKTFVRVREGAFTGGSLVLLKPAVVGRVRPVLRQVVEARKNPAGLASLLGPATVLRYMMGRLSVADVEQRAWELTGLRGVAVVCSDPEVALDLDVGKPENLELVERELRRP